LFVVSQKCSAQIAREISENIVLRFARKLRGMDIDFGVVRTGIMLFEYLYSPGKSGSNRKKQT